MADFSIVHYEPLDFEHAYAVTYGRSTDTKISASGAVKFTNGSLAIEVDTGDVYMLNAAADTYVKQFSLQG